MRIALGQLNPVVGDLVGNAQKIGQAIDLARGQAADLLVTSELVLIGYPPRDLLLRAGIVEQCQLLLEELSEQAGDLPVLIGHPAAALSGTRPLVNRVSLLHHGEVQAVADKRLLPGYDVFDEDRYFEPGQQPSLLNICGTSLGVLICEDLWRASDVTASPKYPCDPTADMVEAGAEMLVALNASPFFMGKGLQHLAHLKEVAQQYKIPVVAVNQVGANDDLIFDGRSAAIDADGTVRHAMCGWQSAVETISFVEPIDGAATVDCERAHEPMRELFHGLVLGVHDYWSKTGNQDAVIGLSGGIDSALTATLAVAALGPQHVQGVMMPSEYSSEGSLTDALALANNLGMPTPLELPIEKPHRSLQAELTAVIGQVKPLTDENLQARVRGVLLMALANDRNALLLATGNKSELAVGYSTIYGDMCGAVAVLGDVLKTVVYELSKWINQHYEELGFNGQPIPEQSITKPPSAELRPNQKDQDSLPPYEVLDQIITGHVDLELTAQEIAQHADLDQDLVEQYVQAIDRAQYKRDQAAVILKVTGRAFGRGRPMPIVMKSTLGIRRPATSH